MEPKSNKSSILGITLAELAVVVIIGILILFTLNFFKVISIPFLSLPLNSVSKNVVQTSRPAVTTPTEEQLNNARCRYLPAGVSTVVPPADPKVSEKIRSFLGIWEGKWGDEVPAVLIVRNASEKEIRGTYIYDKKAPQEHYFPAGINGSYTDQIFTWYVTAAGDKIFGTFKELGKTTGQIEMYRCIP